MRESKAAIEMNALLALRAKQHEGFVFDRDFLRPRYVEFLLSAGLVERVEPSPVVKWARVKVTDKGRERLVSFFEAGV